MDTPTALVLIQWILGMYLMERSLGLEVNNILSRAFCIVLWPLLVLGLILLTIFEGFTKHAK